MTAYRIGCARYSTRGPGLDLQLDALRKAGCNRIYEDTISGTKSRRPGFAAALDNLRDGDTLVVWKLDRIGQSVNGLLSFTSDLNERGIDFVSLTDEINTTTVSGHFYFFNVIASLAQMEREHVDEFTQAGGGLVIDFAGRVIDGRAKQLHIVGQRGDLQNFGVAAGDQQCTEGCWKHGFFKQPLLPRVPPSG